MKYEITGTTRLTGLLGSPVAHSISPQMHNEAFRALGLDYAYLAFDIDPKDLKQAVEGLKLLNIRGFNLTMPHKTAILDMVDTLTPAAMLANAVNTVTVEDGKLIGHTTDGIGYMRSVEDAGFSIIGKKMTLLGAGGAATAICTQAALDGVTEIDMFKRKNASWESVLQFIKRVSQHTGCKVSLYDIEDTSQLKASITESAILTNATNVGMAPDTLATPIPTQLLDSHIIVSDIIYNPRETKLLQDAKNIGCPVMNGLYMLLYQGAASFECWTGHQMPISDIKMKYFSE
ncbi:MAG: shikimate dehydrogenase [Lachnospiraceae bacterium]|nr:shikimate dehydrogenase [Lachnospiraceae bacterium]MDD7377671.1 shikimate dehydrogenase [Lachnospiraceae bacterium]MDY4616269.1 shikimate dehydrogenase [Lachnospiraceae bacterium]